LATYVFRCPECSTSYEVASRSVPGCYTCGAELKRDYRAEAVGIAIGQLKAEREHSKEERMATMLPTNEGLAGPGDPDGTKGIRKWREQFSPADDNKKPWYPGTVEKKVF